MMGEIWRSVETVPGILVSSEGRVMVVPHVENMPNGGTRVYGGVPHFGTWSKPDARFVVTHSGKTYKVARLVAEAFIGPPPFEGALVLHLDECASNNRAGNLCYGDQQTNLAAPGFIEYCRSRVGPDSPVCKSRRKLEEEWRASGKQPDMFGGAAGINANGA